MPHTINEKCTGCGKCLHECPVKCIIAADIYKIDPDICLDCGICHSVCPYDAVSGLAYYRKEKKIR